MKDCPSNLTVYDPLMLGILARRPRDWDLFAAYARWKMDRYLRLTHPGNLGRALARRFRNIVHKGVGAARSHTDRS